MSMMPRRTAPLVGPGGLGTREWLDYLQGLAGTGDLAGVVKAIERLQQQVAELERAPVVAGEVLPGEGIRTLGRLPDGWVRVALAELEDAGGGELVKIARDSYGRVAGTAQATTDDLPEGFARYFTDERVQALLQYQRMTADGDYRITADGHLRVSR